MFVTTTCSLFISLATEQFMTHVQFVRPRSPSPTPQTIIWNSLAFLPSRLLSGLLHATSSINAIHHLWGLHLHQQPLRICFTPRARDFNHATSFADHVLSIFLESYHSESPVFCLETIMRSPIVLDSSLASSFLVLIAQPIDSCSAHGPNNFHCSSSPRNR